MKPALQAIDLTLPPRLPAFSLALEPGRTTGLLGVNGAGKSTILMALASALSGMRGWLLIDGEDARSRPALHRRIGWLPQQPPLYPDLTVQENLAFFAGLHGHSTIDTVLQRFSLEALRTRLAHRLSGGERMRLGLACTLAHDPPILLLDEPTAGLDPLQAEQLRELIQRETPRRTVLIASHLLPDIEQLCIRVPLIDRGRIVADGPLASGRRLVQLRLQRPPDDAQLLAMEGIAGIVSCKHGSLLIELEAQAPETLAERVACQGWGLQSWQPEASDLPARFRALSTGETT